MSNALEQPSSSSNDDLRTDLGGSDVAPPGDSAVEATPAGKNVPLPKEEVAPKRRPRVVKKKPVEEIEPPKAAQMVADPMFFAGLNTTLKMMVQQEHRHRLSCMAIV